MTINHDAETIKDPANRKQYCWLSGTTEAMKPRDYHGPWYLQIAHIASGGGRAKRVNDRRAVILLNPIAHQVHVSNSESHPCMSINCRVYKTIDERHTLWIKQQMDPEFFDMKFLEKIWIGKPPQPEPPPQEWNTIFMNNTGLIR